MPTRNYISQTKEELLSKYQVRKSRKQKEVFAEFVKKEGTESGYKVETEKAGSVIKSHNIIVGNVETAKYIFTAHYDTCAISPFPNIIWLKNPVMYWLFQALTIFMLLGTAFVTSLIVAVCVGTAEYTSLVLEGVLLLIFMQMMVGIRNPKTANDNTSGVLTLLTTMKEMPKEYRDKVAFVFFDNEEIGLFGSRSFNKAHNLKDKCIVNFDCVGEGDHTFFIYNKKTSTMFVNEIKLSSSSSEFSSHVFPGSFFDFASDQHSFDNGVGVTTARRSKLGGYRVSRLHTPRDIILDERNVANLSRWVCVLVTAENNLENESEKRR